MQSPQFIHLRVHSDFSMVDGLQKVNALVKRSAELNMPALALTDRMNLCGLVRFYSAAQQHGIKPIIGVDLWIESHHPREPLQSMTALAMDNIGYQNLTRLISDAYLRGYVAGKPHVRYQDLQQYNAGIILLSGGMQSSLVRRPPK